MDIETYRILSLLVPLVVGVGQIWVVLRGINAMKEASEIRDRAHERRHQETMAAIKSQHNEAMEAIDRRHEETMTALKTLIERTAPA